VTGTNPRRPALRRILMCCSSLAPKALWSASIRRVSGYVVSVNLGSAQRNVRHAELRASTKVVADGRPQWYPLGRSPFRLAGATRKQASCSYCLIARNKKWK